MREMQITLPPPHQSGFSLILLTESRNPLVLYLGDSPVHPSLTRIVSLAGLQASEQALVLFYISLALRFVLFGPRNRATFDRFAFGAINVFLVGNLMLLRAIIHDLAGLRVD